MMKLMKLSVKLMTYSMRALVMEVLHHLHSSLKVVKVSVRIQTITLMTNMRMIEIVLLQVNCHSYHWTHLQDQIPPPAPAPLQSPVHSRRGGHTRSKSRPGPGVRTSHGLFYLRRLVTRVPGRKE